MSRVWVKPVLTLALILIVSVASGAALAQRHGGRVHFGFHFGVPIYAPLYYPPYYSGYYPAPYYYPPVTVAPSSPPVYIEQDNASPAPVQSQNDWYYCAQSNAYYPYVRECPAAWQRVPAQPPSR